MLHWILCIAIYQLYSMSCKQCIVSYASCSMHHILCIVLYALNSMHLYCMNFILSIVSYALYSMQCILCIVFHALYSDSINLYFLYCILCIVYYVSILTIFSNWRRKRWMRRKTRVAYRAAITAKNYFWFNRNAYLAVYIYNETYKVVKTMIFKIFGKDKLT